MLASTLANDRFPPRAAGAVLAGGRSRRMGAPKDSLPFGTESMLQRVVRLLGETVQPVAVVARTGQQLPALPSSVLIAHDRRQDCGPLEGLAAALECLQPYAEVVFVTACDAPLLRSQFVRRMIALSEGFDIAVPRVNGFCEPLAAVYRTDLLEKIQDLLAGAPSSLSVLFERFRTRYVAAEELSDVDPRLQSLINLNHPTDYQAVLRQNQAQRP
jgi:molybdopterin-guanine dinucleotide biosynthesis protein A